MLTPVEGTHLEEASQQNPEHTDYTDLYIYLLALQSLSRCKAKGQY